MWSKRIVEVGYIAIRAVIVAVIVAVVVAVVCSLTTMTFMETENGRFIEWGGVKEGRKMN